MQTLVGIGAALIGGLAMVGLTFVVALFLAPYRQRNEARTACDALKEQIDDMSRIRLEVHRAAFLKKDKEGKYTEQTQEQYYFINATSFSSRTVLVTHVWYDGNPMIPIGLEDNSLPHPIEPSFSYEWFVPASVIPDEGEDVFARFRAQLSTKAVIVSQKAQQVPSVGVVPGRTDNLVSGIIEAPQPDSDGLTDDENRDRQ